MREPTLAEKLASRSASRAGTRCMAALSVVSRMNGPLIAPCASAVSTAMRAAMTEGAGETRS